MVNRVLAQHAAAVTGTDIDLHACRLLNVSMCAASVAATRFCRPLRVAVYNPLPHVHTHAPLVLPAATGPCQWKLLGRWPCARTTPSQAQHATHTDEDDNAVPLQAVPLDAHTRTLQSTLLAVGAVNDSTALGEFSLTAVLPVLQPWRVTVLTLQPVHGPTKPPAMTTTTTASFRTGPSWLARLVPPLLRAPMTAMWTPPPLVVSNGNVTLVFSPDGRLTAATVNGVHLALSVDVLWYTPSDGGGGHGQCGGAYILRVGDTPARLVSQSPVLSVVEGEVVTEVHQTWSPWASIRYR